MSNILMQMLKHISKSQYRFLPKTHNLFEE